MITSTATAMRRLATSPAGSAAAGSSHPPVPVYAEAGGEVAAAAEVTTRTAAAAVAAATHAAAAAFAATGVGATAAAVAEAQEEAAAAGALGMSLSVEGGDGGGGSTAGDLLRKRILAQQKQGQQLQQQCEEKEEKSNRIEKPHVCSLSSDVGPVAAGTVVLRPFLRGKIHLLLFFLSPIWIFLLLSACSSTRSIIAAAISCLSFVFNFLASALLHCFEWADRPALQQLLHKVDHAGIFFVISGSTSPIPVLLLDASSSFWLLLVQFIATCYGFVSIIFGDLSSAARKRRAYTYVIVGLLHALFLSEYYRVLTQTELLAVFTLSILYVLGALVYGFKWPDPFPAVYGFHEVFHSFCLLSFLVTVWLDYVIIQRAEWSPPLPAAAAAMPDTTTLPQQKAESNNHR